MKVITLDNERFRAECARLQNAVAKAMTPDLVVAIANGGVYVGQNVFDDVKHVAVTCRRPTSTGKDSRSGLFSVVRRLPVWVRDLLRVVEAKCLSRRNDVARSVVLTDDVAQAISLSDSILIVDDAIDSGHSMLAVYDKVNALNPSAEILTAALTVTTDKPAIVPDCYLYAKTLIRFPWSNDFA